MGQLTMRSPPPPRVWLPTHKHRARNVRQRGDLAIAQRRVNMLPLARACSRKQRRHNGVTRVQPCRQIRDRNPHLDRRTISAARDMHEPHLRLNHDVVACFATVGPGLAVAGDAGIDEGGVDGGEGGVVEGVLGEGVGKVVFYENIALLGEGVKDGDAGGMLEGEGEGFFVAVYLVEECKFHPCRVWLSDMNLLIGSKRFPPIRSSRFLGYMGREAGPTLACRHLGRDARF